jgi:quinol-cytochrome oxidoreductase complex cytochrome b subunit
LVIVVLAFINTIIYLLWLPWLRQRRLAKALRVDNSRGIKS